MGYYIVTLSVSSPLHGGYLQPEDRFCFLIMFVSCPQLLDFSPLLMTGNELNPGDHLGGSEAQNHKLELRKVGIITRDAKGRGFLPTKQTETLICQPG